MITISEIVKDGILEIKLPDNTAINIKLLMMLTN
jgi:hypothetical protein